MADSKRGTNRVSTLSQASELDTAQAEISRLQESRADALRARISELEMDKHAFDSEILELRKRMETYQEQMRLLGRDAGKHAAITEQLRLERNQAVEDLQQCMSLLKQGKLTAEAQPRPQQVTPVKHVTHILQQEQLARDADDALLESALNSVFRQRDDAIDANRALFSAHMAETERLGLRLREAQAAAQKAAASMRSHGRGKDHSDSDDPQAMMMLLAARQRETEYYRAAAMMACAFVQQVALGPRGGLATQKVCEAEAKKYGFHQFLIYFSWLQSVRGMWLRDGRHTAARLGGAPYLSSLCLLLNITLFFY